MLACNLSRFGVMMPHDAGTMPVRHHHMAADIFQRAQFPCFNISLNSKRRIDALQLSNGRLGGKYAIRNTIELPPASEVGDCMPPMDPIFLDALILSRCRRHAANEACRLKNVLFGCRSVTFARPR